MLLFKKREISLSAKITSCQSSFNGKFMGLHLFETHCTFLPLFNPSIDFLQALKVTKSSHHLSHDRASKGYGSIPCLTSQTSLNACLQRLNTMQISLWHQTRNRPMPLTSLVVWQMMARFRNFYNVKKSQDLGPIKYEKRLISNLSKSSNYIVTFAFLHVIHMSAHLNKRHDMCSSVFPEGCNWVNL